MRKPEGLRQGFPSCCLELCEEVKKSGSRESQEIQPGTARPGSGQAIRFVCLLEMPSL